MRIIMFTDPGSYMIHMADLTSGAAHGAGTSIGDDFQARANPDWTQPFDVVVLVTGLYCDLDNREVARYHFRRLPGIAPGVIAEDGVSRGPDAFALPPACIAANDEMARLLQERRTQAERYVAAANEMARLEAVVRALQANTVDPLPEITQRIRAAADEYLPHRDTAADAKRNLDSIQAGLTAQGSILSDHSCPEVVSLPGPDDTLGTLLETTDADAGLALLCEVTGATREGLRRQLRRLAEDAVALRQYISQLAQWLEDNPEPTGAVPLATIREERRKFLAALDEYGDLVIRLLALGREIVLLENWERDNCTR
jgi:hypothetical protein